MFQITVLFFGCFAILQSAGVPPTLIAPSSQTEREDITDYYWREYTGIIPSDAIPGGSDRSGKATYIGQMYSAKHGLLPATIYPGSKSARASAGGVSFSADTFVKILCSRNHDKYYWIPTKNEDTHLLTNCQIVVGGTELGFVLNIGRVNHEMETVIGKVFAHHTPHKGLHIPNKEKEASYQSYDILTYNCNKDRFIGNITFISVY